MEILQNHPQAVSIAIMILWLLAGYATARTKYGSILRPFNASGFEVAMTILGGFFSLIVFIIEIAAATISLFREGPIE